jgi:hypothetical protein
VRERLGAGIALVSIDHDDPVLVMSITQYGYMSLITLKDGKEYYISESWQLAVDAVRQYWADMAAHDPRELVALLGEDNIVEHWVAGMSFEDWVEQYIQCDGPAALFASYDGAQVDIEVLDVFDEEDWADEGGFFGEGYAYRHN